MAEKHLLIVYETKEGQTARISERISDEFEAIGYTVTRTSAKSAPTNLKPYDAVILGGSVHAGNHGKQLMKYAKDHSPVFTAMPSAFFSVSLTAVTSDDHHQQVARDVANRFVDKVQWHPDIVAVFGGALMYREYGLLKRQLMKHIAKGEDGPTDTSRDWELTDWRTVEAFVRDFHALVAARYATALAG